MLFWPFGLLASPCPLSYGFCLHVPLKCFVALAPVCSVVLILRRHVSDGCPMDIRLMICGKNCLVLNIVYTSFPVVPVVPVVPIVPVVPMQPCAPWPVPLCHCAPVPLKWVCVFAYPCPIPLHPYTPTPLYSYTPIPLYPYTPTPQYAYTPIPLYPYTPIPIYPYTPIYTCIPLYPYNLVLHIVSRFLS